MRPSEHSRAASCARAALLGGLVVLAGCGAARPVKYYQLEIPSAAVTAQNPLPVNLLIGHISAPHLFRDDPIVYHSATPQMGTYQYHRWAEPPTDMIEHLLDRTLRDSGHFRSVAMLHSTARGDYIVHGRLLSLEEVDNSGIFGRFSLSLEMYDPKTGRVLWSQTGSHDEPVKKKAVPAVVEALDRSAQIVLEELTQGLAQYFAAHPPN